MMKQIVVIILVAAMFTCCTKKQQAPFTYFVNSETGNDANDGLTPETAWKSLERASANTYYAGNKLLLANGVTFKGKLKLQGGGSEKLPVLLEGYNPGDNLIEKPIINAAGYIAGIQIENGKHFKISNIEIVSDAGEPVEEMAGTRRYGVWISAGEPGDYPNIQFHNLYIHNIFATENIKKDGQNPTSNMGYGFFISMTDKESKISNIHIEGCKIEKTGHTGIRIFGFGDKTGSTYLDGVTILNNQLEHIGGPGMVPGRCKNVLVQGNTVNYSGSSIDPRMHNRGSGIWPWTCDDVLIEKNKFMNAWGKMDSYGCHIDYNCNNVVVQHNLSVNNSGGFVEILGNNSNCSYRYNISINDGYREKGVKGVVHDGKLLWTSGYVGNAPRKGPFNSYIYNNTIFVKKEYETRFSFAPTTDGLLIANNIFYVVGESVDVKDNEVKNQDGSTIQNVVFMNNLYQRLGIVPGSVKINDTAPFLGDPMFKNPGGINPEDYIPQNIELIKDKGIEIEKIPGDKIGLTIGLEVETDYFGNPIQGLPDIGAIELE